MLVKKTILKSTILAAFLTSASVPVTAGGIPVFDGVGLGQAIVQGLEQIRQTAQQVQQYQAQLQQLQVQLKNATKPSSWTLNQAQNTINGLLGTIDTLKQQRQALGSTVNYLKQFKTANEYKQMACLGGTGCTSADIQTIKQNLQFAADAEKLVNEASIKGLEQQQNNLASDAATLQTLQNNAQGADGQLKAIGYANQIASHQSGQLLQIRSLLISQQNLIATRNQTVANREAVLKAARSQARNTSSYVPSTDRNW